MSKRIAIVQSSYLPWKGYFDLIASVDEFVLYDDAQYTKRDWRNRNRIKTANGLLWLTIPVEVKGRFNQRVRDAVVADRRAIERHWRTIQTSYARAACFREYESRLESLFRQASSDRLSEVNCQMLSGLCRLLDIQTRITWSMDYRHAGNATQHLLDICDQAGATTYLSGPSARSYLDVGMLRDAGIAVEFMDYTGYPEYPQLYPPFEHTVSVIDLLMHTGCDAPRYMLRANRRAATL